MDVNTDKAINANSRAIDLAGYKSKEDFIQNYNANDHYKDISKRQELLDILKQQGKLVNEEVHFLRKDGSEFWGLLTIRIADGVAESSLVDVTQLKLVELQLKNSLEEKEILLKEIHHRVKNNLQVVWGLVDLQQRKLVDKKLKDALADSKQRINTMALIHETLYKGDSLERVQMENYTSKLIQDYKVLYANEKISPDIVLNSDDFTVDLDKAVPIGLIINELVSNAYKHAFKNKKNGLINIEQRIKKGTIHINISDNGAGFNIGKPKESIGLRLVNRLCQQLGAKLNVESKKNQGTSYHVQFKN
jgi:PAS domain S-box-containing protein